tara:strand:- start:764 stop:976 length:213 start_codon:yes stop_codon:yes gene_type:complete
MLLNCSIADQLNYSSSFNCSANSEPTKENHLGKLVYHIGELFIKEQLPLRGTQLSCLTLFGKELKGGFNK